MLLRLFSRKWAFQTVLHCRRLTPSTSCCSPVTWLAASGKYRHEYLQDKPLSTASLLQRAASCQPALLSRGPKVAGVTMSRIVQPDDTTFLNTIHGGVTLSLSEQAGYIAASRHCNAESRGQDRSPMTIGLARVDHMDFHEPIYAGNVAELQAAVTFTSPHSMEVTVDVWAENLKTGRKKCTNTGTLWYIALPSDVDALKRGEGIKPLPVPQLEGLEEEDREEGRRRYEAQKASRRPIESCLGLDSIHPLSWFPRDPEEHTVQASQTTFPKIIHPSDCTAEGFLRGGSILKLMDEAAGMCTMRHYRSLVVTACVDAVDFHCPVRLEEGIYATARVVFTSGKTMEVEVIVEAEGLATGRRVVCSAFFTFAAVGKRGPAVLIPPLKLQTSEERERFEDGRRRYEARKKLREQGDTRPRAQT